jgi:hypothetical protein
VPSTLRCGGSATGSRRRVPARLVIPLAGMCFLVGGTATATAVAPQSFPGTPNPGGTEEFDIAIPPPNGKYFGFIDNSAGADWQLISVSDYVDMSLPVGANAHRLNLDWRYLERTRDQWTEGTWALFDGAYNELLDAGIQPVLNIGFAPVWARDAGEAQFCTSSDCRYPPARWADAEWSEFAAEVATRFPEGIIEVWNEPNIPQFWRSGPNPQRFAELLNVAHDAIKTVHPSMTVLAGGINNNTAYYGGTATTGPAIPIRNFLDEAYAAQPSIKHNMDALSIHTTSQEMTYGAGYLLAKVFDDVRSIKAKYSDSARRIWVTEAGLSTTGPTPRTLIEQADALLRQYRRFMTMRDVDAMLVNALVELSAVPGSNVNRGYGFRLHNPGFPVKPVYCAFSNRVPGLPVEGCSPLPDPVVPEGSEPGEFDPNMLPDAEPPACVAQIAKLTSRIARLKAKRAVYKPWAQQGHKPSKRAVRRFSRKIRSTRAELLTLRQTCVQS